MKRNQPEGNKISLICFTVATTMADECRSDENWVRGEILNRFFFFFFLIKIQNVIKFLTENSDTDVRQSAVSLFIFVISGDLLKLNIIKPFFSHFIFFFRYVSQLEVCVSHIFNLRLQFECFLWFYMKILWNDQSITVRWYCHT